MVQAVELVPNNLGHMVNGGGNHSVEQLMETAPANLLDLVLLYCRVYLEGSPDNTVKTRMTALEHFLKFYADLYHHLDPKEWYVSTTRAWVQQQQRDKRIKPGTVASRYASVRHFARWAHRSIQPSPFPLGLPTEGVKPPEEPAYKFAGLSRKNMLRMMAAAETLAKKPGKRGSNTGIRDRGFLHVAFGTGLRISEIVNLDVSDYDPKKNGFRNVIQKGSSRREFVKLWYPEEHKPALQEWLEQRGDWSGLLFCTRTLQPLSRSQGWYIIKQMAKQANALLPEAEKFTVSPHPLRHTLMRRIAEDPKYGIHYTKAASGHKSDKYVWTYTEPSNEELEELE